MPYGAGSQSDDHVIEALDEVEACDCNTGRVHLGGTSNGGRLAYRLALFHADLPQPATDSALGNGQ